MFFGRRVFALAVLSVSALVTFPLFGQGADPCADYPMPVTEFQNGVPVDKPDNYADRAIQCRIDHAPADSNGNASYSVPAGTWLLGKGIVVRRPISIGGSSATLYASPGLTNAALIRVESSGVTISGLHFFGNRDHRGYLSDCAIPPQDPGPRPNAATIDAGAGNFRFDGNRIDYTLCGSAFLAFGIGMHIDNNIIAFTGFPQGDPRADNGSWGDGISLGANGTATDMAIVHGNTIVDATDVSIAVFGPRYVEISGNRLLNLGAFVFGGTGLPFKHGLDENNQTTTEHVGPNVRIKDNIVISKNGLNAVGLIVGGAGYDCHHSPDLITSGQTVDASNHLIPDDDHPANSPERAEYDNNHVYGAQLGLAAEYLEHMILNGNTAESCVPAAAVASVSGLPPDLQLLLDGATGTCSRSVPFGQEPGRELPYVWDRDYTQDSTPDVTFNNPGNWIKIGSPELPVCTNAVKPPEVHLPGGGGCTAPILNGVPDTVLTYDVPADGAVISIPTSHKANCAWTTTLNGSSWEHPVLDNDAVEFISSGVGGGGQRADETPQEGLLVLRAKPQIAGNERTNTYTLTVPKSHAQKSIVIHQCGAGTLSASQLFFTNAGGQQTVTISGTDSCGWSASAVDDATNSSPSWLSFTPAKGTNGSLTIQVQPFDGGHRSATVTVAGRQLEVVQRTCPTSISSTAPNPFPASSSTALITVVADGQCGWSAHAEDSWVHFTGADGNGVVTGTGNGTIGINVDPNTSPYPRSNTITIGDLTYVVNQLPAQLPSNCVDIKAFGGTSGTILDLQNIVFDVDAPAATSFAWHDAATGAVVGNGRRLLIPWDSPAYPVPPATKSYYVEMMGQDGCGPVRSNPGSVTVTSSNIAFFHIVQDPPSTVNSPAPGATVAITIRINDDIDPSFFVTWDWFQGLTGDESHPVSGASSTNTSSTLNVSPFASTFYWCKVTARNVRLRSEILLGGSTRVVVPVPPKHRAAKHDFNGDGKSDIVWRNRVTGEVRYWAMDREQHIGTYPLPAQPLPMQLQSIGDLSGEGAPDLIYRNPATGENSLSVLNGVVQFTIPLPSQPDPAWYIGATADMDGDGHQDLVWFNKSTAEVRIWFMNGTTKAGSWSVGNAPSNSWRLQGTGDFNRDNKPDLVLRDFATGENVAWLMNDYSLSSLLALTPASSRRVTGNATGTSLDPMPGAEWRVADVDDVTSDDYPDLWWYDAKTGQTQLWWMLGTSRLSTIDGDSETNSDWEVVGVGAGAPPVAVASQTTLSLDAAAAMYGTSATISATLSGPSLPIGGKTIAFTFDGLNAGNATTDVNGVATVTFPLAGFDAGTHSVTAHFAGDDAFKPSDAAAPLVITPQPATVKWSDPAPIVAGTPLGPQQLDAHANVFGTFVYTPAAGTLLSTGTHTLSVTFTPESPNYAETTATVTITVLQATPVISWPAPAAITYGTLLSSAQLDATADVAGTFAYSPAAGTLLSAGTHTLSVTFTPENPNYAPTTATVTIAVNKALLTVDVTNASKAYSAVLPPFGGTITGIRNDDPITATYASTATQSSPCGTYPITATLIDPNGRLLNYDVIIHDGVLTITRVPLVAQVDDATKQYSDPLPAFTATITGFVPGETPAVLAGTLVFHTDATALSGPGTYAVTASGLSSNNYDITWRAGTLTVTPEDAGIVYTGPQLLAAGGKAPTAVSLFLTATVTDANDGAPGDLRNARVTFVDRSTSSPLCSAAVTAAGAAACSATVDLTGRTSLTIGSIVGGWYAHDDRAGDVAIRIVAAGGDFLTGGGHITAQHSAGSLAADAGSTIELNAAAKYNNPGLSANAIVSLLHGGRSIVVTATSFTSAAMISAGSTGLAELNGVATIQDVSDPASPVVLDRAARFTIAVDDEGEPGSDDTIAITIRSADGALTFSSRSSSGHTVPQTLAGGNFQVHDH